MIYIVCNYYPPGNITGQKPYWAGQPAAAAATLKDGTGLSTSEAGIPNQPWWRPELTETQVDACRRLDWRWLSYAS